MFVLIPVLIGVYVYVIYRKYYIKPDELETDGFDDSAEELGFSG